jgi:hypothetical protein
LFSELESLGSGELATVLKSNSTAVSNELGISSGVAVSMVLTGLMLTINNALHRLEQERIDGIVDKLLAEPT